MGNPPELYHKILNIPKDTSPHEIRAAYKNLVKKWHPDKHPPSSRPEAEARFKAISEAYEALLDQQENRGVFELCNDGRAGERTRGAFGGAGGGGGGGLGAGGGARMERTRSDGFCTRSAPGTPAREFKKVYSSGDPGGRRAFAEFSSSIVRKAPPLERKLECTLEELCRGCKKEVSFTRDVVTKNGSTVKKEVTQTVVVKPGWRKGKQVVLEGMGDERPGCLPGDAILTVSEKRHPAFKRVGDDLVLKAEVPLVGALTGWSFSFRLLGGRKVSCSFQDEVVRPGYEKVIAGEGMPVPGQKGARGDMRVKFDVVFPKELTAEQRAGLAEILRGSC
ncbi:DnaJ subfamily B member 13 [Zea mays]|uniref:DnaJ subfamily B member 13 n=1 Tax=Zea mays TaxID=4577 RepID=A0A3L6FGE3_MAIZE|nr:DnaJ subfamily B member 13 [Zea mays]